LGRIFSLLAVASLVTLAGALPGTRADAAAKTPPGDPPGNNGTIKVKNSDPAEDPNEKNNANQPHIDGCILWLSYTGFDQAQTADITFTAHEPSGKGEVLIADKSVAVSPDAAGGGQDQDVVIAYNLTSAVQGLKRQPQQGYHIKVASDTKEAPGGAKQKVFWVNCNPAPPSTLRISKATQGTPTQTGAYAFTLTCNHRPLNTAFMLDAGAKLDVPNVPAGTSCVAQETDSKGANPVNITETPSDGTADGTVKVAGNTPTTITFTNVFPGSGGTPPPGDSDIRNPEGGPAGTNLPAGAGTPSTAGESGTDVSGTNASKPETSVLGETATKPEPTATLPRTGNDPRPLTTAGLGSLFAGGLALLGGRRLRRS
jgi:hypothetical protein